MRACVPNDAGGKTPGEVFDEDALLATTKGETKGKKLCQEDTAILIAFDEARVLPSGVHSMLVDVTKDGGKGKKDEKDEKQERKVSFFSVIRSALVRLNEDYYVFDSILMEVKDG